MALPAYMNELWQAYFQMSQEDRRSIDLALVSVDPLTCNEKVLPYLAWECGVDISGLDIDTARKLIDGAINSHRMAGTIYSLDAVLAAFGKIEIKEWFETGKAPYTFDLDLSLIDKEITLELIEKIEKCIYLSKNVRSRLDEMLVSYKIKERFGFDCSLTSETKEDIQVKISFESLSKKSMFVNSSNISEIRNDTYFDATFKGLNRLIQKVSLSCITENYSEAI